MRNRALALVLIAVLAQTLPATDAFAQDWNPFDPFGTEKKRPEPEVSPQLLSAVHAGEIHIA